LCNLSFYKPDLKNISGFIFLIITMQLLVYTPIITPRIQYIFEYLFNDYLQIECQLTTSVLSFTTSDSVKFSYAPQPIGDEPWVWQHMLLLEEAIKPQTITLFKFDYASAFFSTNDSRPLISFDLFAASFYLMTRYEEYLSVQKDRFGRFLSKNSVAIQATFLRKPIVNQWIISLMQSLLHTETFSDFSSRSFTYIPTYDIDHAYQYRHKSAYINLGGMVKDFFHGKFDTVLDRIMTLLHLRHDAYDTYKFIFMLNKRFKINPFYFILCADKRGKYDRNIPLSNKAFRRLLLRLHQHGIVGLHPSFAAGKELKKIVVEKHALEKVLNQQITHSRQHYLLLYLPNTYRALSEAGIKHDFTMGYAGHPGFRASVCTSFRFFDLLRNEVTDLRIHPLAYMDGSFNDYLNLTCKEAKAEIKQLIDEVQAVNGEFVSLWHNNALSNKGHWYGWRAVYYSTLEYAFRE
jgi:hypothetical protein